MTMIMRGLRSLVLVALVAALWPTVTRAGDGPPNWKVTGAGTTEPQGDVDVDEFQGKSTHLGRFAGEGFHSLYVEINEAEEVVLKFDGEAEWTAANGDILYVFYSGEVFPSGDPDFQFGFKATIVADGGTGRLADAEGEGIMTGAFTGVPGNLRFQVLGTLHPRGK